MTPLPNSLREGNPWFGEPWPSIICEEQPHMDTPVGEKCLYCEEEIGEEDSGVMMPFVNGDGTPRLVPEHKECFLRSVIGGRNHLERKCSCYGGTEPPDPEGMTRRGAAIASWDWWQRHGEEIAA